MTDSRDHKVYLSDREVPNEIITLVCVGMTWLSSLPLYVTEGACYILGSRTGHWARGSDPQLKGSGFKSPMSESLPEQHPLPKDVRTKDSDC